MANELQEYLAGLGLRDEAIEKAVELAAPETFRPQLAELGGKVKSLESELSELRPLKEAPQRKSAAAKFGHDYEAAPKYLKAVFDAIPADKLEDADFVSQHLRDNDVEVTATTEQPTGERPAAAAIVDHATSATGGATSTETYEQAINAAQSQEELDAVYARFNRQPVTT